MVYITDPLVNKLRLTNLDLNASSEIIDILESPLAASKAGEKSGINTPAKPPSTPKQFPESLPKSSVMPNPFSHLSVPSQTVTSGPSSGSPSPSTTRIDRTPSPKPESTKPNPIVFSWEAPKSGNSGTPTTKPSGGLFGLPTGPSVGGIFGALSPKLPGEANADTKPLSSGLFSSKPSLLASINSSATPATKSFFADLSSTKSSSSSFTSAPTPAPGVASGVATGNTSTGGSGTFSGIAPAKNDNSLK
ncbi:hypothetical protein N431DRAFT_323486 [Stipitochalara longipes BDJ]|nr:hypothetical protein N431DRAFT_323486 [Stipitochalara longipes BDJ]